MRGGCALGQGWSGSRRLPGAWPVPLTVPILRRAAGTTEGTIMVSTLRTPITWQPQPLCARALCHVSLAPLFLGLRFFCSLRTGAMGKPSICRINRIRELLVSAGFLPWGAASRSCMARFKPSSLPAARAEDLPPAPARPQWAPASPAEMSWGRESLPPGLPLATLGGSPDSAPQCSQRHPLQHLPAETPSPSAPPGSCPALEKPLARAGLC